MGRHPQVNPPGLAAFIQGFQILPTREEPSQSSVQVSAAVTAYARIAMSRFMHIPGNPVLYSDTDSLLLQHPLSPELIEKHVSPGGNELGKLKYEGKVKQLVVVGPKQIAYLDSTGQECVYHPFDQTLTHALILQAVSSPHSPVYAAKHAFLKQDLSTGSVRVLASTAPSLVKASLVPSDESPSDSIVNALGGKNPFGRYSDNPKLLPKRFRAETLTSREKT